MKICIKCKKRKDLFLFYKRKGVKDGVSNKCKDCSNIVNKIYGKKQRKRLKEEVISIYGNRCTCCGEDEISFLSIHHINFNGNLERKQGLKAYYLYNKIINDPFCRESYTLLCMNCNSCITKDKACPHKEKRVYPTAEELNKTPYPKYKNMWGQINDRKIKLSYIKGYGGRCYCCGESQEEFVTMEHAKEDRGSHSRRLKAEGKPFNARGMMQDAILLNFPDTYQLLCMNCNFAQKNGSPCPHTLSSLFVKSTILA